MPIRYVDFINEKQADLDFADLVTIIKGSSIKSMAIADDYFELGLTDAFNLRINGSPDILLMSTLNKEETPPIRLQLLEHKDTPSAKTVEIRIHALRQLYATTFLINVGRSLDVFHALKKNPNSDLEELLDKQDRLFVTAAGEGSFWVTVLTRTKQAFKSLTYIVPLFYEEGRQALLERVRATTDLKKLDVNEKQIKIAKDFVGLAKELEKVKDPELRKMLNYKISESLSALGKQPISLPPPEEP